MVKKLILPIWAQQFPMFVEWTSQARKFYFLGPCSPSILLTVNLMPQTPWYQEEVLHRVLASILAKTESCLTCGGCLGPKDCWDYLAVFAKAAARVRDSFLSSLPQIKVTSPRCCHPMRPWLGYSHSLSLTAAKCGAPLLSYPDSFLLHYLGVREGCDKYAEPHIFSLLK